MAKPPPVSELEFLKLSGNHLELARKLSTLACAAPDLLEYAKHVSETWFRLAEEHLAEGKTLDPTTCPRAVYSRAYYAAYNASKAARYIKQGSVSLKGDDHGRAATDLPGDFPDVVKWARTLVELYEHRLRADYDNWTTTGKSFAMKPSKAIKHAEKFVNKTRAYLKSKCGMIL
jgi:uncharacterized protein (UPF0332 family)